MNLLSRVHTRQAELMLGNMSVNLSGLDSDIAEKLTTFIQAITPLTLALPINIQTLDCAPMTPKKNYDTNKLEGSIL